MFGEHFFYIIEIKGTKMNIFRDQGNKDSPPELLLDHLILVPLNTTPERKETGRRTY